MNTTEYLIIGARPLGGEKTDILIKDGVTSAIGESAAEQASSQTQKVAADGWIALPGLVDLHTHLREPGREDAETIPSGTQGAARGGFTSVHAMPNPYPVAGTAGVV